jgi:6-phosphogluconolactonase
MNITRRALLERFSACALLGAVGRASAVEYKGCADCIEVFRGKRLIQRVASGQPSFLTVDHARNLLFAVNEIDEYEGLPTGSVESYAVAPESGLIELLSRRPLALSAIRPRHLAISPDGKYMVVAVYGGGAYNVLAIEADGKIGALVHVFKEIGLGASAHPHSVVFHPSGQFVVGTDLGCDRNSVFAFDNGRLSRSALSADRLPTTV